MNNKPNLEEFDALMRARHSCRGFLPEELPRETIVKIVEAAQRVPSWCNAQPWHLTITSGDETARLREFLFRTAQSEKHNADVPFPEGYHGVYRDRRRECGWQLYEQVGVVKGDRQGSTREMMKNFRFFDAPHVALITSDRALGQYGVMDCGGFVTGFCLAAEAAGIATIPQAAPAGFSDQLREYFNVPDDRIIVCAISFGLRDEMHPANQFRTGRAPISETVDWK